MSARRSKNFKPQKVVTDPEKVKLVDKIVNLHRPEIRGKLRGWTVVLVDQTQGWCRTNCRTVTIPLWALEDRGVGYLHYYICHELAHVEEFEKWKSGIYRRLESGHGEQFYRNFKRICPSSLQHWEHDYLSRSAAAAGIPKKEKP